MNKTLGPILIREQVIKAVREFFYEKNFHEVITPILNPALPIEPNIYAFSTEWSTSQSKKKLYLATSPESGLKKMLAQGIGNCFAIGKVFRTLEGTGSLHNPEFLMLEWYRENATYEQIMKDTKELVIFIKNKVDVYLQRPQGTKLEYQSNEFELDQEWPVYSLRDLFKQYAGIDYDRVISLSNVETRHASSLPSIAEQKGYTVENATWAQLFDQIFVNEIESHLPPTPFFLTDFPARISPLCKVNKEKPYLAERFEFYLAKYEIANGNNENTDYRSIEKVFEKEREDRLSKGLESSPIDKDFLHALETMSDKNYAGIGLGIDRLAMIFADTSSISSVEYFTIK